MARAAFPTYTVVIGSVGGDAETGTFHRLGNGGDVGTGRQAHFARLEVDGERRRAGAGCGTGDGLHAAVAIHASDLEDEFVSHVI